MEIQYKIFFVWSFLTILTEAGKRTIRSHKCKYTFVVNELDASSCPNNLPQVQADSESSTNAPIFPFNIPSRPKDIGPNQEILTWMNDMNKQLVGEIQKVKEMNTSLIQQSIALTKAEEQLSMYQSNFSTIFRMLRYMENEIRDQNEASRNLDNKLSGIMLDVVEVNNVLSKKVPAVDGKLQDKEIKVQSVSKVSSCSMTPEAVKFKDCAEVLKRHNQSGVYYITPTYASCAIPVWCDMETTGGGWLMLLKRKNGELTFKRLWDEYKLGFGNVISEHYLGNDNLFLISNQDHYEVRVDLWDFEGNRVYALYKTFKIEGERDNYKIHIHGFEGSARDAMLKHNGAMFSTADRDNDGWPNYNCAQEWEAGWWFSNCWFAFLTGPYYNISKVRYRGISWNEWKHEQLAHVEMKIRPKDMAILNTTTKAP